MAKATDKNKGGQPKNKNAEKWSEAEALSLGNRLIDWLKESRTNIFMKDFLILQNDYYNDLIVYLSEKYTSFSELIKRAKEIQEIKLLQNSTENNINPTMTIFILKNNHGWKDKQEVEHTGEVGPRTLEIIPASNVKNASLGQ